MDFYLSKLLLSISFICFSVICNAQETTAMQLHGVVKDKDSGFYLSYVSIGIQNKGIGTVSDSTGKFSIQIEQEQLNDSLLFSIVGYESKKIAVRDMISAGANVVIVLQQKITQLSEITIGQHQVVETVGRQSNSKAVQFSFINKNAKETCLGSEIGMKIKPDKLPAMIQDFNWNLSGNNLASIKFRINVYSLKNNFPDTLITRDEIYVDVTNAKTGWNKIDLTPYQIIVKDDFVISLEWVENSVSTTVKPQVLIPGGLSFSTTSYYRLASQDKWKKGAAAVSYYVTLVH